MIKKWFSYGCVLLGFIPSLLSAVPLSQEVKHLVGQLLCVGIIGGEFTEDSLLAEHIREGRIGGIILYERTDAPQREGRSDGIIHNNVQNPQQLKKLTHDLQSYYQKYNKDKGPLLICVDQEGGIVINLKSAKGFTDVPSISARELGRNAEGTVIFNYAKELGEALRSYGINVNFAPVVDLGVDENNFIFKRKRIASADPSEVFYYARVMSAGQKEAKVISCLKHYPGHGSSLADTHNGFVDVTNTWREIELEPYKKMIASGYSDMIMVAHVSNKNLDPSGEIMTFSRLAITDKLRNELGFSGAVITDDLNMNAVNKHYSLEEILTKAINAGADILLFANHYGDKTQEIYEKLLELVQSEKISLTQIQAAHKRVKALKERI